VNGDSEKESVKGDYGEERNESNPAVYKRLLRTPSESPRKAAWGSTGNSQMEKEAAPWKSASALSRNKSVSSDDWSAS
jgi:hypothetical protein